MSKKLSASPLTNVLAVLFLIVILAGLSVRFWASDREYGYAGPTHIAAGDTGVFVFVAGDILHLSPEGSLLAVLGKGRTQLSDDPIDLRLLEDGTLLVAEQRPARIRVCDPVTWVCGEVGSAAASRIERQLKVLPFGSAWLITDAHADALWSLGESTGTLAQALPAKTLAGPNGIATDDAGNPWIADTDNRRIVELLPLGDGTFVTGREHSAMNALTIANRHYPMMLERGADGRFWVAQAAEFSEPHSDLVVYDPERGAVDVVTLPGGAYATDIAVLGGDVLVSDMERFTIYRVAAASGAVSDFGGGEFQDRLGHYRSQRAMYRRLGTASLAAIVITAALLIFAAIRATPGERRWSPGPTAFDLDKAPDTVPHARGAHWLERNPKVRWLTTWLERVFYVLFGLFCLVSLLLYAWSCQQPLDASDGGLSASDKLGITLLLACLALASFLPMMRQSARVLKRRIGSDGKRVHFELEDGRKLSVEPAALAWNNRALIYRQYTFPMHAGHRYSLYAAGEVETWLAPLLRDAKKLGEWQTLRHQWKHRDALILAMTGAIAFTGFIIFLIELLLNR